MTGPFSEEEAAWLATTYVARPDAQLGDAADAHWLIYCGVLVFSMQSGFAMLCAGSVRAKNAQKAQVNAQRTRVSEVRFPPGRTHATDHASSSESAAPRPSPRGAWSRQNPSRPARFAQPWHTHRNLRGEPYPRNSPDFRRACSDSPDFRRG